MSGYLVLISFVVVMFVNKTMFLVSFNFWILVAYVAKVNDSILD